MTMECLPHAVNRQRSCHEKQYFEAKMHQLRFRMGLRPRPHWIAYSDPPDPLAGLQWTTSKGKEGEMI